MIGKKEHATPDCTSIPRLRKIKDDGKIIYDRKQRINHTRELLYFWCKHSYKVIKNKDFLLNSIATTSSRKTALYKINEINESIRTLIK